MTFTFILPNIVTKEKDFAASTSQTLVVHCLVRQYNPCNNYLFIYLVCSINTPLAQTASIQTVQLLINNQLRKLRKQAVLTSVEARSEGSQQRAEQTAKILNQNRRYRSQHSKPQTPEGDDSHEVRAVR
jgi:hypothetical protein